MRIGLLSDTHSFLDPKIFNHFAEVDEIWHGGDIGDPKLMDELEAFKTVRAVYGNIDEPALRHRYPEDLLFTVEDVRVFITHIGGYPGRYNTRVRKLLDEHKPKLYICGHSHILKVIPDAKRALLHVNPGACGHHGFHKVRTLVRFSLTSGRIHDMEVIELGLRGRE
ncbi:metallophosphoesterase [Lewinella sp. LCG006]|uniref:metallophosphoesterase family protein n=1 Tax=Lewinella sp. LCG006 TaxID=3231911 RepID=UPI00346093BF